MPSYKYATQTFGGDETVDIPGEAVGVTIQTFGDPYEDGIVRARYLLPADAGEEADA